MAAADGSAWLLPPGFGGRRLGRAPTTWIWQRQLSLARPRTNIAAVAAGARPHTDSKMSDSGAPAAGSGGRIYLPQWWECTTRRWQAASGGKGRRDFIFLFLHAAHISTHIRKSLFLPTFSCRRPGQLHAKIGSGRLKKKLFL